MTIRHCLECGEQLDQNDDTCYQCPYGHQYFNNPRAGAAVIFLRDGRFLASQRAIEPHKGKYSFVGGFLEYGEEARTAAIREVHEETGVTLTKLELLDVVTHIYQPHESTLSIMFLAKQWHGEFSAHDDAARLVWKPLEFIESDEFAWHYPGLVERLRSVEL